jgi:ubiquinone/menaquinone biosynthesis C-methylase UbiE
MLRLYNAASNSGPIGLYDRLAPDYDRLHQRWLRHAGGEAQAALEATVRALTTRNTNLLDVGCGTGAFARGMIAEGMEPAQITLLDPSDEMLARCADIPARQVNGRLEALPFEDRTFEIVTCAWALETAPNTDIALRELCRVVRRGGVLCIAFCADIPARTVSDCFMRHAVTQRGAGRFLSERSVIKAIENQQDLHVRSLPCRGPVAALIARRTGTLETELAKPASLG